MRYFIGNLIRGEMAEYYRTTCADLSFRFGVANVAEIVPPHITVKSPFERANADAIDDLIALSTEVETFPLSFEGWGHFGDKTIYIDAPRPSPELKAFMSSISAKFKTIGIPPSRDESMGHLHASIARFLKPRQYSDIWKYLQSVPKPTFDIKFDNLTIFYKENNEDKAWKVLKTFPLLGKR